MPKRGTSVREDKPAVPITLVEVDTAEWGPRLKLVTPYHPVLPASLKSMGGKWSDVNRAWYLPLDMAEQARHLCLQTFGVDPLNPIDPKLVTVRYTFPSDAREIGPSLWRYGRQLVYRRHPDAPVQLGKWVQLISGGFDEMSPPGRTAIVGYPAANTVLEIRDVPESLVEADTRNKESGVVIVTKRGRGTRLRAITQIVTLYRDLNVDERREVMQALKEVDTGEQPATDT